MMKTKAVWKFQLNADDYTTLHLPVGAKPLDVQEQGGGAFLWCLVDPNETAHEERTFRLAGTGHPITENVDYIGTFQTHGGRLVWHLFELRK